MIVEELRDLVIQLRALTSTIELLRAELNMHENGHTPWHAPLQRQTYRCTHEGCKALAEFQRSMCGNHQDEEPVIAYASSSSPKVGDQ